MAIRQRIVVRGIVQGIGFRPQVHKRAVALGLAGVVSNRSDGAVVEVEGAPDAVAAFIEGLRARPPLLAEIHSLEVADVAPTGEGVFRIARSEAQDGASTPVLPDLAICADCLRELRDPADRRFGYPFINCTHCGPRFTILRDIPYDRRLTTMAGFRMCAACAAEYEDPGSRRFHAQPNACWDCGPSVWFVSAGEDSAIRGVAGMEAGRALLARGGILAVKGIGGFHLACDATNADAVALLRERKGRGEKPFAVMVADLEQVRRMAEVSAAEQSLLTGVRAPIVLLRKRADGALVVADAVAPGQDSLGVLLPYTPLHHLLMGEKPLVMTSGNRSEEPIAHTNGEALERLAALADGFLLHDREIHVLADDSVVRVAGGRTMPLRRSRGYAPLPVRLAGEGASVLAVGGELKATFCLTRGEYAYLSQHIGDVGNWETQAAFGRAVEHFLALFRVKPEAVVCDRHPGYLSRAWARETAAGWGVPLLEVAHHHAHLAALRAEHGLAAKEALLGVVFDGTGYGDDGSIWGGEFLLECDGECRRVGHLKPVMLPGGDAAIRHPWRAAVAHLLGAGLALPDEWKPAADAELRFVARQVERNAQCTPTSSAGRLFDAAASLLGVRHSVSYEAQAAMELEALARGGGDRAEAYPMDLEGEQPLVLCPAPLWRALLADVRRGVERETVAARFHGGVALAVAEACERLRARFGVSRVGLSGGVFQNVLLSTTCRRELEARGLCVVEHETVPANDGGISLGQAALGRRALARAGVLA